MTPVERVAAYLAQHRVKYPLPTLKASLLKQGVPEAVIEQALAALQAPVAQPQPTREDPFPFRTPSQAGIPIQKAEPAQPPAPQAASPSEASAVAEAPKARGPWPVLGLLLAVPLVGLLVSHGIRGSWNRELRAAISTRPDVPAEVKEGLTVDMVCAAGDPEMAELCGEVAKMSLMAAAAWLSAFLAVLIVACTTYARLKGRRDREQMLEMFLPLLYGVVAGLSILTVLNAGLAIAAVWYGESWLVGRVHMGLILGLALGALYGCRSMVSAIWASLGRAVQPEVAKVVDRLESPALWDLVEGMAAKIGTAPPTNIIAGLEPNFYVTEVDVKCADGTLKGRTFYLSLPFLRLCSAEEFRAVLGHELGHFVGRDTYYSTRFYPIYRGTGQSLEGLSAIVNGGGSAALAALPAFLVLAYFWESFVSAETEMGRERELAADAVGARAESPKALALALLKLHAFVPHWDKLFAQMVEMAKKGDSLPNVSESYVEMTAGTAASDALVEEKLSHPTDSHPTLAVRLAKLGMRADALAVEAVRVPSDRPVWRMIGNADKLERELSWDYSTPLIQSVGPGAGITS